MNQKPDSLHIYLIRHASPDWSRTDIPYDIPPGPPLLVKGEHEAELLGVFIRQAGLKKLYHSPLERTKRTAQIIAQVAGIGLQEDLSLAEWRSDENAQLVGVRLLPTWEKVIAECEHVGSIGLVTHGGPITVLLRHLGMDQDTLGGFCHTFDHHNPLPPAGVWLAKRDVDSPDWDLSLVFTPPI